MAFIPDESVLGRMFGGRPGFNQTDLGRAASAARKDAQQQTTKTAAPLPQIRGKQIDGVLYVRAEDVAAALETQAPTAARKLIDKLRKAAS